MFAVGLVLCIVAAFMVPKHPPRPAEKPRALVGALVGFVGTALVAISLFILLWRNLP